MSTTMPRIPRPCRAAGCITPTTNPSGRCDTHTRQANREHNQRTTYYHSTEWRTLREACLTRDYHQCVLCGSNNRLVSHHIHARKDGGADTLSNLATLCHYCHNKVERGSVPHLERLNDHTGIDQRSHEHR